MDEYIKKYKVNSSTINPELTIGMIGLEFERYSYCDYNETLSLNNENTLDYYFFNLSDVQECTPFSFNGNTICIGDTVNLDRIVYGYHWYDGKYVIDTLKNNDYINGCSWSNFSDILDHIPLYPKKDTVIQEAIALLEKNGFNIFKK